MFNDLFSRYAPLVLLSIAVTATSAAQDDGAVPRIESEEAVEHAVVGLFDAMRAADGGAVRAAFLPNATLHSVSRDEVSDAPYAVESSSIDAFVEAIAGDHPVYDERISNLQVRIDEGLATAWMDYAFYIGDDLSHCGVNAFQFVLTEGRWKILHVTDTRRKGCE